MTHPSRTLVRHRRHAAIALGLAAFAMAAAVSAGTGVGSDAPLRQPSATSADPPVQDVASGVIVGGGPRSGDASPRPSPTAMSDLMSARHLGRTREALRPDPPPSTPDPPAPALHPPPTAGRFALDLYDKGDFVSQARADWCVPASILAMMNMIDGDGERSTPSQRKLDRLARSLSTERLRGAGSEPEGWAGSLNKLGAGPYEVRAARTRSGAIEMAARALRLTGRPVGLLIWRGAHAWVMSGFRATADPAFTDDFRVTHVRVVDPWYPRVSSIWGPAQRPDAIIPVRRLAEDFLAWRRPTMRYPEKDRRFVLVVPVAEAGGPS